MFRKLIGAVVAMLLGAYTGGLGIYLEPSMSSAFIFVFLAFCAPVFAAGIYGIGGIASYAALAASTLISAFIFGGWTNAIFLMIISIIPSSVMVFSSHKGVRFFSQVRNAMIAELIVFVVLLAAVRMLTGQDFASYFKNIWLETAESMPQEGKEAFLNLFNTLLAQSGSTDVQYTADELIKLMSEAMEQTITVMIPIAMVVYAFINGAISVLLMNWLRTKHTVGNVQFVPLRGWRLPKHLIIGLIVIYIAVLIIGKSAPEAGVAAEVMVIAAIFCASLVQASASILSRLTMAQLTSGKRTIVLFFMYFFAFAFLPFYGILSALVGSKGLFAPRVRRAGPDTMKTDKHDDNQQTNQKDDTDKEE